MENAAQTDLGDLAICWHCKAYKVPSMLIPLPADWIVWTSQLRGLYFKESATQLTLGSVAHAPWVEILRGHRDPV